MIIKVSKLLIRTLVRTLRLEPILRLATNSKGSASFVAAQGYGIDWLVPGAWLELGHYVAIKCGAKKSRRRVNRNI